jgi:hypothetical protein
MRKQRQKAVHLEEEAEEKNTVLAEDYIARSL